ncbi:SPOR domain-containing protein [Lentibacter sp.]|uniref:SPOR domain-containing protein n=1 Tax=Lentibacter sp. TaxID=2024994 RepID=UPI003F698DAD
MSCKRVGALCAFFLTLTLSTAQAQALRDVDGPVNFPPGSYKGKQFVDNNGCAFVRAGIDGRVNWIPRVTRSRKLLCGLKPTFSGAEANLAQAQSANAPVQITNNEAPAAAAPAPAPAPRVAAAKPAAAPKPAPRQVQRVTRATTCANFTGISAQYAGSGPGVRCGSQTQPVTGAVQVQRQPVTVMRNGQKKTVQQRVVQQPTAAPKISGKETGQRIITRNSQTGQINAAGNTRVVPRHVYNQQQRSAVTNKVPKGFRKAWDDDRLNPKRAQMTVEGIRQSDLIWTRTIPRKLYVKGTGRVVNNLFPELRYPYTSMNDQNAAMGLTTSSRSKSAAAATPRKQGGTAKSGTDGRYVQVGMFASEANAQRAAQRISAAGLPARFGTLTKGGKSYRLVMAGPFGASQINAAVATARRAGFSDAYAR